MTGSSMGVGIGEENGFRQEAGWMGECRGALCGEWVPGHDVKEGTV